MVKEASELLESPFFLGPQPVVEVSEIGRQLLRRAHLPGMASRYRIQLDHPLDERPLQELPEGFLFTGR